MRQEVIIDRVASWEASFFSVPNETWKGDAIKTSVNPPLQWVSSWPAAYKALPAIVRLTFREQGTTAPITLTFVIPRATYSIPCTF